MFLHLYSRGPLRPPHHTSGTPRLGVEHKMPLFGGAAQTLPPGQIRGQKAEQTEILSTNRIQVFPGLVSGEDSETENGTDRNSVPGSPPEHQVRPVGAILRPPLWARHPGCGSKSQAHSHPLLKTLGGRSQEREPELTEISFQGGPNGAQTRPPGPTRGQKTEQTLIPSTNRIQVCPGLVPGEDSGTKNGTDRNSIPGSPPEHQVRPVGSTMHPSPRARTRFSCNLTERNG
ncbi:hypothetical protein ACLKA7_007737 [Drosophila subpalustris]